MMPVYTRRLRNKCVQVVVVVASKLNLEMQKARESVISSPRNFLVKVNSKCTHRPMFPFAESIQGAVLSTVAAHTHTDPGAAFVGAELRSDC